MQPDSAAAALAQELNNIRTAQDNAADTSAHNALTADLVTRAQAYEGTPERLALAVARLIDSLADSRADRTRFLTAVIFRVAKDAARRPDDHSAALFPQPPGRPH